jgi:hypothetical protein
LTLVAAAVLSASSGWPADERRPVRVRHTEGVVHGFLVLSTLDGTTLADGDLIQVARGDRVTSRLIFKFKDGSVHEETAVFTQRGQFRLLSAHLVQKGPAFEHPMEVAIDAAQGRVTVHYTDDGKEKVITERMKVPPDVANGVMLTLLKNVPPNTQRIDLSWVAATPKPRLVKLEITAAGEDSFSIGNSSRKAMHYVVKVDIGGITGLLAELLGKQPPDSHIWIALGEAPAFVKLEGPLALGGPPWRIELTNPVWPDEAHPAAKR